MTLLPPTTERDLATRLREAADYAREYGTGTNAPILREAADALDTAEARVRELEGALREMLVCHERLVILAALPQEAHTCERGEKARAALGQPRAEGPLPSKEARDMENDWSLERNLGIGPSPSPRTAHTCDENCGGSRITYECGRPVVGTEPPAEGA